MGEVVSLRLQPIVRVQHIDNMWGVTVRPCPVDMRLLSRFDSEREAAAYATSLKVQHGWRIRPEQYDLSLRDAPGAA